MEKGARDIKYIAVFSVTILVFLLGVLLGNYLANLKVEEMNSMQDSLSAKLIGLELRYDLLRTGDICNLSWDDVWKEKIDMGSRMIALEVRLGKTNDAVLRQKEVYQLIEIRTLILLEEIKEQCKDVDIILFFYTNKEKDSKGPVELSENQGFVLDSLYREYPEVSIFSFDMNTENPAISALEEIYKIKTAPSIVINEKTYEGFISKKEIEGILFGR